MRLIPTFNEGCVDVFFSSFARLTTRLSWSRDQWTLVLQQSFKSKGLKAYMALSDVGPALMKMSKNRSFRPILWCQKFRSLRKTAEQSHLEAFISWYRSQEVTIYEQLVQLILMEAFTLGVDRDVASCLAQKRVKTVEEAATVADNYYVLARKESHTFISRSNLPPPCGKMKRPLAPLPQGKGSSKPAPAARQMEVFKCTFCGRTGHKAEYC